LPNDLVGALPGIGEGEARVDLQGHKNDKPGKTEPLRNPGRSTLTGPAAISLREAARDIEAVLNRPIAYQPISAEQAEAAMLEAGMDAWDAAVNAEYGIAYAGGWGDFTTSDLPDLIGRPGRSFAEFAIDHAGALLAAEQISGA
jgi:hypothetical protein